MLVWESNKISYIDVSIPAQKLAKDITNWEIKEQDNLSDHRYFHYELKVSEK